MDMMINAAHTPTVIATACPASICPFDLDDRVRATTTTTAAMARSKTNGTSPR